MYIYYIAQVFLKGRTHLLDHFPLLAGVSIHAYVAQKLCRGREYYEYKTMHQAKEAGNIQVLLRG